MTADAPGRPKLGTAPAGGREPHAVGDRGGLHLRDKRLQRALNAAPDAQARPSEAVRETIKTVAISAINTRSTGQFSSKKWWEWLWQASGSRRSPWNAAFATLLLGGVITLLWQGQEPPSPMQEEGFRQAAVPAVAPAAEAPAPAVAAAQ